MFRTLLLLTLAFGGTASAQVLEGPIRIIDADTIDIGADANIRLLAIDAPEGAQTCTDGSDLLLPCGRMMTDRAREVWEGRRAACKVAERDRFGRYLATCFVEGEDLNGALVRAGLALRYRDDPTYLEDEKEAILLERGVWAYQMENPAVWRARMRAERAEANAPTGACDIKGNISGAGRLYHLPGMASYGPTRINEARGERWFCTEDEARSAGWRRAGG